MRSPREEWRAAADAEVSHSRMWTPEQPTPSLLEGATGETAAEHPKNKKPNLSKSLRNFACTPLRTSEAVSASVPSLHPPDESALIPPGVGVSGTRISLPSERDLPSPCLLAPYGPWDRAALYNAAFPSYPPLCTTGRWVYGMWVLGNNYRGSGYYGAYPPGYLKRVLSLFPDATRVLSLFSGSLQGPGVTLDCQRTAAVQPQVLGSAEALPFLPGSFDLCLADPPYSPVDAVRYATPMVSRRKVLASLAHVIPAGGHVVWLDTQLPMYRKAEWHLWGTIGLVRSTNHRVRLVSLFERVGPC
jgi:hypothetical protein